MEQTTCGCAGNAGSAGPEASALASVSRRGLLAGGAAAVALVAAGCSGSGDEASGNGAATTPAATNTAQPSSPEATTSATGPSDGGATGERLAGTGDVPLDGGVVVMAASGPVVVTQPSAGQYLAFNGKCPHAGCAVASVDNNVITCPCHGSTFDATTGMRLGGPAPTGLVPLTIAITGDSISLA